MATHTTSHDIHYIKGTHKMINEMMMNKKDATLSAQAGANMIAA